MTLKAICLALLLVLPLGAQGAPQGNGDGSSAQETRTERTLASLAAVQRNRAAKQERLEELREQLAALGPDDDRSALQADIRTLQQELDALELDFESIATGVDLASFDSAEPVTFDLQDEVLKLLQPLVEELKDATEAPRQIDRLRGQIAYLEAREQAAGEALAGIEELIAGLEPDGDAALLGRLRTSQAAWQARIESLENQRTVAAFQLENRLSQRTSILQSTKTAFGEFFRTRGLNLTLAVATFFLVLVLLRGFRRFVSKVTHGKQGAERRFYARLLDVLYFLFAGILAVVAALLVLYATGDWVLLAVALLFLLGVVWAFKTTIPMFLEQIRLLLDLGTVRERERVVLDGIPYRVSKLSFYSIFSNPELAGGVRRLPLKDLMDMRSRTTSKDEIWFPSRRGDWVHLSDGTRGQVVHQSPDMVQLALLGGGDTTYQTRDFLALAPRNVSRGFRQAVRFGIDYAHQPIATAEVPAIFQRKIQRKIEERFGAEALQSLKVEFCEAGASSLDYVVIADFDGSAAPRFDPIGRSIQEFCVDTCNEQGWGIPFTQITVHEA